MLFVIFHPKTDEEKAAYHNIGTPQVSGDFKVKAKAPALTSIIGLLRYPAYGRFKAYFP